MMGFSGIPAREVARNATRAIASQQRRPSPGNVLRGNPSNYRELLKELRPGDTLILEPGTYADQHGTPGLAVSDLHGEPGRPITVCGAARGPRPLFQGRPDYNTVRIGSASYVILCRLELNGRDVPGIDAIKSQGSFSHHITIEDTIIENYSGDQGDVGISTKAPAWDWVIRNNVIRDVGTGMYLGHSDGSAPFVHGLIEYNLIADTIGYNIEIKHQNARENIPGLPNVPGPTIIRHNVFSKAHRGSTGHMARPNLLVGHFPLKDAGAEDVYEIYGNFFYQNPTGEALFQGEGNITLYSNLFFNDYGDAILVRPHNAYPRRVLVFENTIVARGTGIRVMGGDAGYRQAVIGNAVFASHPILVVNHLQNVTASFERAGLYLRHPSGPLGELDLWPRTGKLSGSRLPVQLFRTFHDWSLDFQGAQRKGTYRGAYEGGQSNSGWLPRLEIKPRNGSTPSGR